MSTAGGIKEGVKLEGISPEMAIAFTIIHSAYTRRGQNCTITSALDGKHSTNSFHYSGKALDIRTRDVLESRTLDYIVNDIREALGGEFDVVLESDHLHVEFDP